MHTNVGKFSKDFANLTECRYSGVIDPQIIWCLDEYDKGVARGDVGVERM
jgi:hypothetical protein